MPFITCYLTLLYCRQYVPPRKSITIDFSSIDDSVYDIKPPLNSSVILEENGNNQLT